MSRSEKQLGLIKQTVKTEFLLERTWEEFFVPPYLDSDVLPNVLDHGRASRRACFLLEQRRQFAAERPQPIAPKKCPGILVPDSEPLVNHADIEIAPE